MTATTVLFVCEDNASLSLMAEACMNAASDGRLRAFSAGPRPSSKANPAVPRLLGEIGIGAAGLSPKSWEFFALPHAPAPDALVFLCESAARHPIPSWPVPPVSLVWPVAADTEGLPAGQRLRASLRRIRADIERALLTGVFETVATLRQTRMNKVARAPFDGRAGFGDLVATG
ncbi:low molecular weight phosphatase family protein [Stappia sp. F7233]|uniref:Low molecular weight phosphatase family protein n=1 Tax=Stappia albiluteola TaxID=2758565 RepID=A0A839ADQ1_9HYPH|nr:low molecular weight phosphatase family protein [Stappia albiluteola]MBA5776947.1 low molecular weight phosphatase family protein [Stappia albiluteola]